MSSRTVELILKASDQFSDTTKKLNLQMAAAKISADELNKSVEKLSQKHPGLSLDEAQAAAKALQDAKRGADEAGKSFANANITARGLSQELGITLPRAVTQFLSQSTLIGPALTAAFSTVAIIGFAEALGQLPALYDKMVAAVTGWNDASKKAFEEQHKRTEDARADMIKFKAELAGIQSVSDDPLEARRKQLAVELQGAKETEAAAQDRAFKARTGVETFGGSRHWWERENLGMGTDISGKGLSEYRDELKQANVDAEKAEKDRKDVENAIAKLEAEALTKGIRIGISIRRDLTVTNIGGPGLQGLPNIGGLFPPRPLIVPSYDPMTGEAHFPTLDAQGRIDVEAEQQYQFQKRLNDAVEAQQAVGMPFRQPGIPTRPLITPDYLRTGQIHYPSTLPSGQIDPFAEMKFEEMQRKQQIFVDGFKKASGQVWDAFFSQGSDVLTRLADLAKSWLKDIGQTLFSNLATGLVFGRAGGSSLFGGGLLGGVLGKIGGKANGPWSEAIPGVGGGLLGGLGGLFGGPLGAGTSMGTGPLAGAVVSAPAGGLMGALGLGGGAGLLGLGAATIPVIGGIAAGAALIAMEIFGHHHDAPFTRDPNAIQNTREYLFYTGVQDLAVAAKDMLNFTHQLNTLPTGTLVKQGLPVALASSNQFRRDVSAVLNQDL